MKNTFTLLLTFLFGFSAYSQNYALRFDGLSEYLSVPPSADYNVGDAFTIEAWILADEWKDQQWQGSLINRDAQGPDRGYAFRCGDNGILSFVMSVDGTWEEAFTAPMMNLNQWHHVAAVVSSGTISLYVDGQLAANHAFSGEPSDSELGLAIGDSPGFPGRNFSGVIDEIRIWGDARSQTELMDNMTEDLSGNEADLVAYFPFNEGSGTTAGDITGNAASASLIDMDDTNWVDGYTLPDFDVSAQGILGIDVVNARTRPVKLKTAIQNTGLNPVSGVELSVNIDGNFIFSETINSTINAGEVMNYEFTIPIDLTDTEEPEIQVVASHPDDENSLNNTATRQLVLGSNGLVVVSNNEQHNFGGAGQTNNKIITLPGDMHKYEQVLLHIAVNCPSTGCDPWDQYGNIMVNTWTGTYELARFITPYGIACGSWVVDITDFKSVLAGEVEFLNFIQVWGASGWLLDAQIELIDNDDTDVYSIVTPLWETAYWVYGDPGIEDDLDELTVDIDNNTEDSHLRMTITGHGQGNTNNAAEFFEVDHTLNINGAAFENHHLWKSDCPDNPCANQAGNWLFPRAGWCPGQEVTPYIFNTTSETNPGSSVAFDYVLQDYTNLLNTGYNNSGHTEPHYKIYSYLIEESPQPYAEYQNLTADNVAGNLDGSTLQNVDVDFTNTGFETINDFTINIFNNNELMASESFNEPVAVDASVSKQITINSTVDLTMGNTLYAEVVNGNDDNPGDNVVKAQLTSNVDNKLRAEYKFDVFPNPTNDGLVNLDFHEFWLGSQVTIYSSNGSIVDQFTLNSTNRKIELTTSGLYWYTVENLESQLISGKLSFIK